MSDMNFATRADLLQAVADELDRDDLVSKIPGFLLLAESGIRADCNVLDSTTRATFPINEDYENLPSDFQALIALHINGVDGRVMVRATTAERIAYLREQTLTGTPREYAVIGNEMWFDRTPNGEQAEIAYYSTLPKLVADGDSNQLLLDFPGLYFYGILLHSAPFLREDPRIALWDTLYQKDVKQQISYTNRTKAGAGAVLVRTRRNMP